MALISKLRCEGFRTHTLPAVLAAGLIGVAPSITAAQEDRYDERGPEIRSVADAISARLRSAGLGDHAIAVWHKSGHVTLDGRVASEESKRRAGQIAREIDGVESVENRLRVDLGDSNYPVEVMAVAEPEAESRSPSGRVVGDVTVEVEVNVIINTGSIFGSAGPPRSTGDRPDADRDRHIRELEETIRQLRGELESVRSRREPSEFHERFERMRREAAERAEAARRRAEEMRRNMEENLRRTEPPREAEDERRERNDDAREPERVDGVREPEADADDRAEAIPSILPTLFETLRGFDFRDDLTPER